MAASLDNPHLTESDQPLDVYRQMLDSAGDLIYTVDRDGYLTYINDRFETMLGYAPADALGRLFEKYIVSTWCDHARRPYNRILRQQDAELILEVPMLHQDGSQVWVEQIITPLRNNAGEVNGVMAVVRNIAGRDSTEAELETRVNQLAVLQRIDRELTNQLDVDYVLSMALDATMRLSLADAGTIELVRDGEIYDGKVIGNYPPEISGHYPRPLLGTVGRVLRNREPELIMDVTGDPDYHPYIPSTQALMVIPLISQDRLVGVVTLETRRAERFHVESFEFIQLITTRIAVAVDNAQLFATTRQQLDELQELYRQIMTLEQLKTDMIRIAAHDLGNPLTAISGFVDMLLESDLPVRQLEQAAMIKDSATRMKKIIRDILSLQRIEELAQGTLSETVNVVAILQSIFNSQKYQAAHKNQIFTLESPESMLPIKGDSAQLREAITNIISNALKYTPDGGTVTTRLWEDNDIVYFDVVDNGYGIPEEQQERLFQPFYRPKTKETRQIDGTGLGLHLVKNIVERHHGKMHFVSEYGKGSTFGFSLPLYIGD